MDDAIILYILRFLLGEHVPPDAGLPVAYTSDATKFRSCKIAIIPSGFFDAHVYGTPASIPRLPLRQIEGVPILFGRPQIERAGDTLVVHADLVASAYFLLSRYEEIVRRRVRDVHGRFPGRESLPFKAGFISRPIVDEYGRLLAKWLRQSGAPVNEPPQVIRHVHLTHDVDEPFSCRSWRNVARGIVEGKHIVSLLRSKFGKPENDVCYTFPGMLGKDASVREELGEDRCSIRFFLKAGGTTRQDRPRYNLHDRDMRQLLRLIAAHGATVGLHAGYGAGMNPALIAKEKRRLETALGREITSNRHHFLASREPEDMTALETAGITDDFTMGYADVAGFRLGTSRPVRWINASTRTLSRLILHPLTVMDSTLSESKYMGLAAGEAQEYCFRLTEETKKARGELVLLWHNTSVVEGAGYHMDLYNRLLDKIAQQ
ncbi:MAG: polysaccharide deacetylase family protein [Tannerella sp.]|jgi:hypothetical protein|nr:polysaccharide deacetylase family protein [Tannerella sp.]